MVTNHLSLMNYVRFHGHCTGLFVALNGSVAAGSAYFIGWALAEALNVEGELV